MGSEPVNKCDNYHPSAWVTVVKEIGATETDVGYEIEASWNVLTRPVPLKGGTIDPEYLGASLAAEFPHMRTVIDRVVGDFVLRRSAGVLGARFRPMLIVGPPGSGKTHFAKTLAARLGVPCGEIAGAGSTDDRLLRGTARGWRGAQPALPLVLVRAHRCANPIILVDEVEKAGGSADAGAIRATLLGLLEPGAAASWFDECLIGHCDLSNVNWILTANSIEGLERSFLSRVAVVEIGRPAPETFDTLLEGILREIAASLTLTRYDLPELADEAINTLRADFERKGDLRAMRRAAESALASAARAGWPRRVN
jgi:ATP-dependent Lon protease